MTRFLTPGLSLVLYLLSFNLNHTLTCCNLFYLRTSTYTHRVFVFTGFGLNTFTADTTGTARFPVAISKWQLLFSLTAKCRKENNATILLLLFGQQKDYNSPIHLLLAQCQRYTRLLQAFHLPAPLPEFLLQTAIFKHTHGNDKV